MHIEHIEAFHFRNLERVELCATAPTVVLRGPNAQGKTNLLEALYLCATGRSFRGAAPRELVRHGHDRGWVRAQLSRREVRHKIEVQLCAGRRTVRVDDRAVRQTAKLLELVNVVAFFPDDLRIAKGSPEERRRFLDRAVAGGRPHFVTAALAYHRALRARNALLRSGRVDRTMVAVYDQQLIDHGSTMHDCRCEGLEELAPVAQSNYAQISESDAPVELGLRSGLPSGRRSPQCDRAFSDAFRDALSETYARDLARGITSVGPHRADLHIELDGLPARAYASQGQQRTLVLALKLAELEALRTRLSSPPVLLLDDVSSELDRHRTERLFDAVRRANIQTWISTTDTAGFPLPQGSQVVDVRGGTLRPAMHL